MKILVTVLFLCPLLQGCGLGILFAGAGASKAGTAQIMSAYTEYMVSMEKINLERERAKLAPRPILSKAEWLKGQSVEEEEKEDEDEDGENPGWTYK